MPAGAESARTVCDGTGGDPGRGSDRAIDTADAGGGGAERVPEQLWVGAGVRGRGGGAAGVHECGVSGEGQGGCGGVAGAEEERDDSAVRGGCAVGRVGLSGRGHASG